MPVFDAFNEKLSGFAGNLLEIRRTPLGPLALFTFRDVFYPAALKKSLHFDFPATGTEKFLGSGGCTGIFARLTHGIYSLLFAPQGV
jgi:hypothetical protein